MVLHPKIKEALEREENGEKVGDTLHRLVYCDSCNFLGVDFTTEIGIYKKGGLKHDEQHQMLELISYFIGIFDALGLDTKTSGLVDWYDQKTKDMEANEQPGINPKKEARQ